MAQIKRMAVFLEKEAEQGGFLNADKGTGKGGRQNGLESTESID